MRRLLFLPLLLSGLWLAGCAGSSVARIELPLLQGWYDDQEVYYIVTDASDSQLSAMMQANYVPRLANALPEVPGPHPMATYDRVYKFADASQASVFPSIPIPLGAANSDEAYSPLWHVYEVSWLVDPAGAQLHSADAVLQAQAQGRVSLRATGIIVNCPVVRVGDNFLQ